MIRERNVKYLYPDDIDDSIRFLTGLASCNHEFNIDHMVNINNLILRLRDYTFQKGKMKVELLEDWQFFLDTREVRSLSFFLDKNEFSYYKDKLINHLLSEYYKQRYSFY